MSESFHCLDGRSTCMYILVIRPAECLANGRVWGGPEGCSRFVVD